MTIAQLIAILLPLLVQYSPQLIADIAALIHGNPQQQGETDAAYIARIGAMIDQNTTKVVGEDAAIQNG